MSQGDDWRKAAAAEYAQRRDALVRERNAKLQQSAQLRAEADALEEELGDLDRSAKVFGLTPPAPTAQLQKTFGVLTFRDDPPKQFKDLALELLRQAFPGPMKAKEIQEAIQAHTGRAYHWKTAGMTLYRLAQDCLVRRVGHKWYYLPEDERGPCLAAKAAEDKAIRETTLDDLMK